MPRRRNIVVSVLTRAVVGLVLVGGGAAVLGVLVRTRPHPARTDAARRTPRVMVMLAQKVEVRRQWQGFGTARAKNSADVPARVTATVADVPPEIVAGAPVEAGHLVVRLDDSDFRRQEEIAAQAIADLDAQLQRLDIEGRSWRERVDLAGQAVALALAEYERVKAAQARGSAKQRETDLARQALIAARREQTGAREEFEKLPARRAGLRARRLGQEAQRRLSRQSVERCRITSPLAGVLETVDVEVGESLQPGQRVARVVDPGLIEVPLRLPARARASVRAGDRARLWSPGAPERAWTAPVARLAPTDDRATRTMTVYVRLRQNPARPAALAPGQFVEGQVTAAAAERRWVVPRRAVEGDRILLVREGMIHSRPVEVDFRVETGLAQLGVPDAEWVVLRDPLEDGEMIVLSPRRSLADGVRVRPVAAGEATRAAGEGKASPPGGVR